MTFTAQPDTVGEYMQGKRDRRNGVSYISPRKSDAWRMGWKAADKAIRHALAVALEQGQQ